MDKTRGRSSSVFSPLQASCHHENRIPNPPLRHQSTQELTRQLPKRHTIRKILEVQNLGSTSSAHSLDLMASCFSVRHRSTRPPHALPKKGLHSSAHSVSISASHAVFSR